MLLLKASLWGIITKHPEAVLAARGDGDEDERAVIRMDGHGAVISFGYFFFLCCYGSRVENVVFE